MNQGMLWFDQSSSMLAEKVRKAVAYYQKKYGRKPDLCLVNPGMVSDGKSVDVESITVRPWRGIPAGHMWIGVDEQPEYATAAITPAIQTDGKKVPA